MPGHFVSPKSAQPLDVVVVGGGHNGLVAAGLLAKRGANVVVCERRDTVGGAAVTETPFGPEFKVSALSYVVSLLPPAVRRELALDKFGYHVFPQGPYFAPQPSGGYLQLPDDPARRYAAVAALSRRDADQLAAYDAYLSRVASVLGPLLSTVAPKLGSTRPRDLLDQARLGWKLRRLGVRGVADVTRLFTMSIADLLDEYFTSPELKGILSVSGVIGTWAGPRSTGTAYVMAHHKVGDVGDGHVGSWGFHRGGMGGLTQVMRRAAEAAGAKILTEAEVAKILVTDGKARGVVLADGTELPADAVITAMHPKTTFLDLVGAAELPEDFATDIRRWRSRSGTVKVNFAVDTLPEFAAKPGFDLEVHGGTIVLAPSLDYVESTFQDAVAGRPATAPFADICIPSVLDDSLAPAGKHVVSMFTQWVPHTFADAPHTNELDAYADRLVALVDQVAPGFSSSVLGRQVIGPHQMQETYGLVGGNIFHGELAADQLFHLRPAAGYADYRSPVAGLYQAHSATHGGGGVTGIPALGAVRALLADSRR